MMVCIHFEMTDSLSLWNDRWQSSQNDRPDFHFEMMTDRSITDSLRRGLSLWNDSYRFLTDFFRLIKGKTIILKWKNCPLILKWTGTLVLIVSSPLSLWYERGILSLKWWRFISLRFEIFHPPAYVQTDSHFPFILQRYYERSFNSFIKENSSWKDRSFFANERRSQNGNHRKKLSKLYHLKRTVDF